MITSPGPMAMSGTRQLPVPTPPVLSGNLKANWKVFRRDWTNLKLQATSKQENLKFGPVIKKRIDEAWLAAISNGLMKSHYVLAINDLDIRFTLDTGFVIINGDQFLANVRTGTCDLGVPGELALTTDPTKKPRQVPCRKEPFAVNERVQTEIEKLVQREPQALNNASIYNLPTLDDVLVEMKDARIFSKLDIKEAYRHRIKELRQRCVEKNIVLNDKTTAAEKKEIVFMGHITTEGISPDPAKNWEIDHKTSSPHHHQSNGEAEAAVKAVKTLIKKCKEANQDRFRALLEFRSTPQQFSNKSTVEILLGRKPRTLLPFANKQDANCTNINKALERR
ncbi:hypothetical protein RRG08_039676 [Elysia crispata]|uniref:Uncharacterized protein n=1 Tax=Elysia crispata TaxID=231223 RepID=A0AAE1CUY2_9GAST|nr:hypothetical protein RRG08_039676 [Elysia crispata]